MSAATKSYDHIKNDDVKKLFMQEKVILTRLNDIRNKIKDLRGERETARGEEMPKQQKELEAIDAKITKLRRSIDDLYQTVNVDADTQIARMKRRGIADNLRIIRMDIEPVERKFMALVEDLEVRQKKAEKLQKEVQALKVACGGKNAHNMGTQITSLQKKMAKETEKGNESLAKSIKKDIKALESDRVKAEAYHTKNTELKAMMVKINELSKTAEETSPELTTLRKKREDLEKQLDAIPSTDISEEERKDKDKKRDALRDDKAKIMKEIDQLYKEKDDIRMHSGKSRELEGKMKELFAERDDLEKQVSELNENIPREVVAISSDDLFDLVGPAGATVKQIEEDFGVSIDIRRQEGEAVIKGTACKDCAEAVNSILQAAKENRHEKHMEIDKDVGGEFIGSGGSQIQLLQTQSGCNINFSRETGQIVIVGSEENIEKAVALINDFKSSAYRVELKFGDAAVPFLRGNLMRKWQEQFGCRLIRVDPALKTIVIIGQEENVKKAEKEVGSFAAGAGSAAVINIPSTVPHFKIIGTRGERVRSIEAETECILDVNPKMVKIAGTPENIERAKKLLNTLIAENIQEEMKLPYKPKMHNFLMRRRPVKTEEQHADPNANGAEDSPATEKKEVRAVCLLEQVRVKYNCDRVQADRDAGQIFIRGPKDTIKKCAKELRDAMDFVGMEKEVLELDNATVRYLCLNLNPPGTRGMKTRLDSIRELDGIEEISADFRGESKRVEIIGSKESIAPAKEKLLAMAEEVEKRTGFMEIEAGKIGFLLGTGGRNVRKIEEDFGVMFHIPRTNRDDPRTDVVKISIIAPDEESLADAKDEAQKTINTKY
ncbi:Protein SCP160 [Diplonema papillatum]|nr:Protein SCP160 [Diplonema papillatum]